MQQTEIEHKLSIYKEKGVAEKLKKQAAYVSDSAKLETIKNKIDKLYKDFFAVYEKNSSISNLLKDYISEYNKDLFIEANSQLYLIDKQLNQINDAVQQIRGILFYLVILEIN